MELSTQRILKGHSLHDFKVCVIRTFIPLEINRKKMGRAPVNPLLWFLTLDR